MNVRLRSVLGAAVALFCSSSINGSAANERQEIAHLYKQAVAGDKAAVEDCIARLEAVIGRESHNQLARVYLGSAYTVRSRDLPFGSEKLKTLKNGLAIMDDAVGAAPNDGHVRLVRALTTDSLPFFLGRRQATRDDFAALITLATKNPGHFSDDDLQTIYFSAGNRASADGDSARAINLWREALRHPADPEITVKTKRALANKEAL